jgi:hypothetical protein
MTDFLELRFDTWCIRPEMKAPNLLLPGGSPGSVLDMLAQTLSDA